MCPSSLSVTECGVSAPCPDAFALDCLQAEDRDIEVQEDGQRELLFRDLVRAHWTRLHRFIIKNIGHSDDAEDLTQQAFAEAVNSYAGFQGKSELSTWLYGIAMNLVRNYLARAPHRRYDFSADAAALDDLSSEKPSLEEELIRSEQVRALLRAMEDLPKHMREILMLVAVDELSYEDAAMLLSVPIGTVRSRLSRARNELKAKLRDRGVELEF